VKKQDYYFKYIKYKIKYLEYKEESDKIFKNYMNTNLSDGLLSLDFLHDNQKSKVKNKEFYDMINEKEIVIYNGTTPNNLEYFLHNQLIDMNNEDSIFHNKIINSNKIIDTINLKDYICILDKSNNNKEIEKKLSIIFNINKFDITFIGNCEDFLNRKSEINKKFLTPTNKLKRQYLIQAIKIGFLPKSLNKIINFNSLNGDDEKIFNELNILKIFIDESKPYLKKLSDNNIPFYINYLDDLSKIRKTIELIKNKDDIKIYYNGKFKYLVEKIVFSMKEARDIYYVEEIKLLMKKDLSNKYILVTGDLIQSYRCIVNKISTINTVLSIIRFIALYDNDLLNIYGNPFELLTTKNDIINNDYKNFNKEIIMRILQNPIIKAKNNIKFNTKYLNNYSNIYDEKYLKYLSELFVDNNDNEFSSINCNLVEKKKEMDYLLDFAKNNITNKNDLIYIFKSLRCSHNLDYQFDNLIDTIYVINKRWQQYFSSNNILPPSINELTWQFNIFYLTTLYNGFSLLEYLLPLTKVLYKNIFNWSEIQYLI
jgi:hypothetical protein